MGQVNDVRLIATDLDGTLLRSDKTVSARSVQALQAAEQAGVVVVIATGRPPRWVHAVAEAVGHTGLAICANGAVVVDLHSEDVVTTRPLERDDIVAVATMVRTAIPGVAFAVESARRGFAKEPAYATHGMDAGGRARPWAVAAIDELAADDIVKLLIRHESMEPDVLLTKARDVAGDRVELTHSSNEGLLEVSATGVTKASALAKLAADHGIGPDQVVAFGDMPNDLAMLAWAGTSYAMANAHPEVLAGAEHVAPSNDDDGVAHIIEQVLMRR
jgi:Cof subfamily protein (haloacid dehalogenase superfamily)